jgi:pSer/pThr/pTyr-binding forkhead associated (FHA) protein
MRLDEGTMPKLTLQFEGRALKEFAAEPNVTIGRASDNTIVIDNPAVSGHHARIVHEGEQLILEDLRSRNGTFVNDQLVRRHALRHGDAVLVGKHTLQFDSEGSVDSHQPHPALPSLNDTLFLDTHRHRELLATLRQGTSRPAPRPPAMGVLRVVEGRAARSEYELEARTSLIGTSGAALVRLRGWFKPDVAVVIARNGDGYEVTAVGGRARINGQRLAGRHPLSQGDTLQISGLTLEFGLKGDGAHQPAARAVQRETRDMSAGERAATARAFT